MQNATSDQQYMNYTDIHKAGRLGIQRQYRHRRWLYLLKFLISCSLRLPHVVVYAARCHQLLMRAYLNHLAATHHHNLQMGMISSGNIRVYIYSILAAKHNIVLQTCKASMVCS